MCQMHLYARAFIGQFPADTSPHNVEIRWRVGGGTSQYEAVRGYRTLTVTEIDL